MNIRMGEEKDYPEVLDCLKRFGKEALDNYGLNCNDEVVLSIMPKFLNTSLVMYEGDIFVGLLTGFFTTWLTTNEKVFQEVLWYVKPEHRAYSTLLLDALENKCREWGVTKIIMAYFGDIELKDLYMRKGYRFLEAHYLKNL